MWNLHRYLGGAVWLLSHLVVVAAVTFLLLWLGWIGRSRVVGALCKLADMAGSIRRFLAMHYIYRYENMDVLTFPLVTIAFSFAAPKKVRKLK